MVNQNSNKDKGKTFRRHFIGNFYGLVFVADSEGKFEYVWSQIG